MKKHVFARITSYFNTHYGSKWIKVNDFDIAYEGKNLYTITDGIFWGPIHIGDIKIEVITDDGVEADGDALSRYDHGR